MIAFRGTDWSELDDMLSNFRWFLRTSQVDEYGQVQFVLPKIITRIHQRCGRITIIAIGHSLGGGLA